MRAHPPQTMSQPIGHSKSLLVWVTAELDVPLQLSQSYHLHIVVITAGDDFGLLSTDALCVLTLQSWTKTCFVCVSPLAEDLWILGAIGYLRRHVRNADDRHKVFNLNETYRAFVDELCYWTPCNLYNYVPQMLVMWQSLSVLRIPKKMKLSSYKTITFLLNLKLAGNRDRDKDCPAPQPFCYKIKTWIFELCHSTHDLLFTL